MLAYLRSKGYTMTVTSLKCGHSVYSASGYVSEHATGDAVDIPVINGIPVTGNQGPGSITDQILRDILQLQGTMHPHQLISLEDLPGSVRRGRLRRRSDGGGAPSVCSTNTLSSSPSRAR